MKMDNGRYHFRYTFTFHIFTHTKSVSWLAHVAISTKVYQNQSNLCLLNHKYRVDAHTGISYLTNVKARQKLSVHNIQLLY